MAKPTNMVERFWSKVRKSAPTECWEWLAGKSTFGYGKFWLNGKTIGAHIVSWELANNRSVPAEQCVLHKCDNPSCVNPSHLFLGTNLDNIQDRVNKGRCARGLRNGVHTHPESRPRGKRNGKYTKPESTPRGNKHPARIHPERMSRGERNGSARLTARQVRQIRARYKLEKPTFRQLGEEYGVSSVNIRHIVQGRTWRHLLQEEL